MLLRIESENDMLFYSYYVRILYLEPWQVLYIYIYIYIYMSLVYFVIRGLPGLPALCTCPVQII